MPSFIYQARIEAPAGDVFAWHELPGALERLSPPWLPVRIDRHEGIRDGNRALLSLGVGPARLTWVLEHRDYVRGRQFRDVQVKGPFKRWEHTHRFEPAGPDACTVEDHVEYELPTGGFGEGRVRSQLERQFAYRQRILQQDIAAHRAYGKGRRLRIAVSGASGLIGSNLVPFLTTGGHEVIRLVRKRPSGEQTVYWNPDSGEIEAERLEGLDAVIHLAGENIFGLRWTKEKKARILDSRVRGTALIAGALSRLNAPPGAFLVASGSNYYGDHGEDVVTEASGSRKESFLASVVTEWEGAATAAREAGIRTVHMRNGIVLNPQGGALQLMLPPFRLGLGARIGSRNQYLGWIGMDDYIHAVYHILLTDTLRGPVNVVSPEPVTMPAFSDSLAEALSRPMFLSIPSPILRLAGGEMVDDLLLTSIRLQPEKLLGSGFTFRYPELRDCLRHELGLLG
jgi:uncharacterized protein